MTEVKDWRSNPRVSKNSIPDKETSCTFAKCAYCANGKCPNPRANKKHEDSLCHKIGNKNFVAMFNVSD